MLAALIEPQYVQIRVDPDVWIVAIRNDRRKYCDDYEEQFNEVEGLCVLCVAK